MVKRIDKYTQEQIDTNRMKWLTQLRDPKSRKCREYLESIYDSNARCCLGHACHALGLKSYEENRTIFYDHEQGILPSDICDMLDITSRGCFKKPIVIEFTNPDSFGPDYNCKVEASDLIEVNDNTDLSPAEIAGVIEEQFANDNFDRAL